MFVVKQSHSKQLFLFSTQAAQYSVDLIQCDATHRDFKKTNKKRKKVKT